MEYNHKECQGALKALANYRELGAVERSHLELHLRRCDSCARASSALEQLEQVSPPLVELTDSARRDIYDRLIPSVHEIALELQSRPERSNWLRPVLAGGTVLAAAAGILLAIMVFRQPTGETIDCYSTAAHDAAVVEAVAVVDDGRLDRLQGDVAINGDRPVEATGKFVVESGTRISVGDMSKVNFRIGDVARIALLGDTRWSVESISDERISLELTRGRMAAEFDGSLGRMLEIRTPESIVRVKGTIFTIEVFDDGATQVSVTRGEVEVVPRSGISQPTSVTAGQLVQVPGTGRTVALGDRQRLLASEVHPLNDSLISNSTGRLVTFDGNQEFVQVELEGRLIGFTPLTVRLPEGPMSYRLSKPGMTPVVAQLENEQVAETVRFSMTPSEEYEPAVAVTAATRKGTKQKAVLDTENVQEPEIRDYIIRAKAAMKAGDLPFAAGLLEETVRRVKGDQRVTATSLLAECYVAMGDYRRAADLFDKVASMVPGTPVAQNARYEVGRLSMYHIGDYDRARNSFTAYVASPVGGQLQEDAYFSLCELYGREGVRNNALQCFNDYIRMFPEGHRNAYARLWRGVLHQEVNQHWKTAERDLMAFIESKPRHPRCEEARYRVALGRYNSGDMKGAMRMYREYAQEHPGGQYHLRMERLKNAISDRINKSRK